METKQVTITSISRKEKTSAKSGKPFTSLGLKTQEYGDKWLSGFGNADNEGWKTGDKVDVVVTEKVTDTGTFYNFETPRKAMGNSSNAEIKNILNLKVLPMLEKILKAMEKDPLDEVFGEEPPVEAYENDPEAQ